MQLTMIRFAAVLTIAVCLLAGPAFPTADAPTTGTATRPDDPELLAPMRVVQLDNGMTFLLYPVRRAPVFSAIIRFAVGGKDEVSGKTGLAHMFEHMAFKGTRRIGTRDWEAEKEALENVRHLARRWDQERERLLRKGLSEEQAKQQHAPLYERFVQAQKAAGQFVVKDEFEQIYKREGATGLNAFTSKDETAYFVSLPANRIELWARMESERLSQPVMREFYSERDVVREERRMSRDNQPVARLWELLMATAYTAHPYAFPTIGWEADIRNLNAEDARTFFRTHYTPERAVGTIVGDIDLDRTETLLRETFGRIPPAAATHDHIITPEPLQHGERRATLRLDATPTLLMGWHKPNPPHPADVHAEVLAQLLTGGRGARLFEQLVKKRKLAAEVSMFSGPGDAEPNMLLIYANPQGQTTLDELEAAVRGEIARLRSEPVSDDQLQAARKSLRADTLRAMQDNMGLAMAISKSALVSGDPWYLERRLRQINAVTAEDLQQFANNWLVDRNLTVARLDPPEQE